MHWFHPYRRYWWLIFGWLVHPFYSSLMVDMWCLHGTMKVLSLYGPYIHHWWSLRSNGFGEKGNILTGNHRFSLIKIMNHGARKPVDIFPRKRIHWWFFRFSRKIGNSHWNQPSGLCLQEWSKDEWKLGQCHDSARGKRWVVEDGFQHFKQWIPTGELT